MFKTLLQEDLSKHEFYGNLVYKFRKIICKTELLQKDLSKPEFYGNLVYKCRKIICKTDFSKQFRRLSLDTKTFVKTWIFCGKLLA